MKLKKLYLIIALLILISFTSGLTLGEKKCTYCPGVAEGTAQSFTCRAWTFLEGSSCPQETADLSLFWETWNSLQSKYVDKSKIDTTKMVYGAIAGMVSAVGDPYTVFFDPSDSKDFIDDSRGEFEGVGMEVGIKKEMLQVVTPLEGTPAQKAGLRAGDVIVKIDGKQSANMSVDEAVDLIRGPQGTEVTLGIYRDEWKETRDIKLIRELINVASVKWRMIDGDTAYIQLFQFTEDAGEEFKGAAMEILDKRAKKIILDLRNDPGGYLSVAQDIAGWFLDRGQLITIEDMGENQVNMEYKSEGPSLFAKTPVVILINGGSASASEILAGALRDNRGIQLIGEKSFGKGSVQQLESLSGGSTLKVTVAKWLTPKGDQISEKGLAADIEVKMTSEDYEAEKDPQLDKAIEIISQMK
jgi:carboxyl-terminal processing protease